MPDKKTTDNLSNNSPILSNSLSDNEIIKAWEWYKVYACNVGSVTLSRADILATNDLITRLQAENENYSKNNRNMTSDIIKLYNELEKAKATIDSFTDIGKLYSEIKAETYKEVLNIIDQVYNKHIFGSNDLTDEEKDAIINFSDDITYKLDNILKELVGVSDG